MNMNKCNSNVNRNDINNRDKITNYKINNNDRYDNIMKNFDDKNMRKS